MTDDFKKACEDSAFGCKILGTALAYGFDPRFAQFWVGNGIYGLWDGVVTLAGTPDNPQEAVAFLWHLRPQGVLCSRKNADLLGLTVRQKGQIMRKTAQAPEPQPLQPSFFEETKAVFHLLECRGMADSYQGFCLDFTHKLRRGLAAVALEYQSDQLAACALCAYICPDMALITAVATHPAYTRRGLGRKAVVACEKILAGRNLFLLKEENQNDAFYMGLGYHYSGRWVYGNI